MASPSRGAVCGAQPATPASGATDAPPAPTLGIVDGVVVNEAQGIFREGRSMFEFLDRRDAGCLDRVGARSWLRGLGWCLDDAALDGLLDEALESSEVYDEGCRVISLFASEEEVAASPCTADSSVGTPRPAPRTPRVARTSSASPAVFSAQTPPLWRQRDLLRSPTTTAGGWPLPRLLGTALRHRNLCGPDLEGLQGALRTLTRGRKAVTKEWLRQVVAEVQSEGGLSEADLEDLFELCGVPTSTKHVNVEAMLQSMVEGICQPKARTARRRASSRSRR